MGIHKKLSDEAVLIAAEGKLMGGPETRFLCKQVEELEN